MESIKELTEAMDWVLRHAEQSVEKAIHCKTYCPDQQEVTRVFEQLAEEMLKEYKSLHNVAEQCIKDKVRQHNGQETEFMRGMKQAYAAMHDREVERYEKVERKLRTLRE